MDSTRRELVRAVAGAFAAAAVPLPASAVGASPAWGAETWPGPGPKGATVLRDGSILCARTVGGPDGPQVECHRSTDRGRTWGRLASILARPHGTDVGDGSLVQARDGRVLYSYRDNHGLAGAARYAIRVEASDDGGRTWHPHSTVATGEGTRGGLWSSFLMDGPSGLQCYYDDERTPWEAGFPRHQWLSMKTWDAGAKAWTRQVTVSRAPDASHLSRDGMGSVVRLKGGRLLCTVETVDVRAPYSGVVAMVHSDDGGKSWSWAHGERSLVYQPQDRRFGAYEPWLVYGGGERVLCVFGVNEDRDRPSQPGSSLPDLRMDIACTTSEDGGKTWSMPTTIYQGAHRNALPGVIALPGRGGRLLCHWLDFDRGFLACEGHL